MNENDNILSISNKLDYLTIQLNKIDNDLQEYKNKQDKRLLILEKEFYNVKGQFKIAITGGAVIITMLNLIFQFIMKGLQ